MTETTLSSYVKEPLVFVQENFSSNDELFEQVAQRASDLGWVREDFLERIKKREATFPTGIQLLNFGVAIPHTDAECILEEFVAVITLQEPVAFKSMEDNSKQVEAQVVFVLGLNQPHAQLEMLQSLMKLIQNEEILSQVLLASNSEELMNVIEINNL
ncbi:PTS sugar transporter subunit IIA [Enterococcus dongliensis]|uniref:PTS sugar transporter subunit IIA n=1 Tax=Enterococcus dongliensis TaxID=2559925 RepID=A0AAW8TJW2_9ENTE|nr:PTS sugar transporter subunit IIA [Enterococcus dongliensis]MDT2596383.1 PTS sugar transporter subunit IIA [Enterococcus dongliensis]MDT2603773.1 PTS sugar transporter subunit IIA [Enterococcus dongliensis]MDT2613581.1 PTS sugar transporter subunit IIA [Enterococcus dongliensis]MDT2634074.1 PTS sugar transporter subunit IIA [Enterococcus dongliensis]MDT2637004.1 PTS sugar transporter subunit IIA [Enterococcus dongliensis]